MTIAENPRIKKVFILQECLIPGLIANFVCLKIVTFNLFLTLLYTLYYEEFSIHYQENNEK